MDENTELQQLLNMGFPPDLSAQALAATGGDSAAKATDWILSHNPKDHPSPSPPPPPSQPKIDKFFHFKSKPEKPTKNQEPLPLPLPPSPPSSTPPQPPEERPVPFKRPNETLMARPRNTEPPSQQPVKRRRPNEPLAERMRPRKIDEVVGQDHILGKNSLLRSAIECSLLPSIILWGPPGTGKTSIAKSIVSSSLNSYRFVSLSAVTCGVKDVREVVDEARKVKNSGRSLVGNSRVQTVLFVDEVHRFNKSQQDSFLPVIEDGSVVFIGATTENPSFHLITPLLSRCRVLTLNPLEPFHVEVLIRRAVLSEDKGLSLSLPVGTKIEVKDEAIEFLSNNCDGDARVALNCLEVSAVTAAARGARGGQEAGGGDDSALATVTIDDAKEALQCKHLAYDKAGDQHYNLISALHKSMRGCDADASIYWLARMLEGGEEPLYIARRLVRFASEDVGLADPSALTQAVACYQACQFIGMPECNVILAQCVAFLALAPKSIAVYRALGAAQKVVKESVGQNEGVPLHLRNAPTKLLKELGYGKDYIYTPDDPTSSQSYLPPSLEGFKFLDWPHSSR